MPKGERSLKVLLATDGLGQGGAERQVALLAAGLQGRCEVRVWSLRDGHFAGAIRSSGIGLVISPGGRRRDPFSPLLDLDRLCRSFEPDVIHSWGWISAMLAEAVCRVRRRTHVNGAFRRGSPAPGARLRTNLLRRIGTLLVANSSSAIGSFGIPPRRGRVLRNAFDAGRLESMAPAGRDGVFTVVMTGVMRDDKDFSSFLQACRILVGRGRAARFLAIGDGPDRPGLESAGADLVESGHLLFTGAVPEVLAYLAAADAGVLLSRNGEGMSNSLLEYMACSIPVVCTDCPGNREMVTGGVEGFLVPVGDPAATAAVLEALMDDPSLRRGMGARGRERVLTGFSIERCAADAVRIYDEAVLIRTGRCQA